MKSTTAALLGLLSLAATSGASAAVTTSGNYTTGSPSPVLNITQPITLQVTSSGNANTLVLQNWVAAFDGGLNLRSVVAGSQFSYQINGGTTLTTSAMWLWDQFVTPTNANNTDGLLVFSNIALTAGDTITIVSQSFTFASDSVPGFNTPPALFTGNVYLMDGSTPPGTARTSSVSVVPEPSTALVGAIGALGFLRRRR